MYVSVTKLRMRGKITQEPKGESVEARKKQARTDARDFECFRMGPSSLYDAKSVEEAMNAFLVREC